MLSSFPMQQLLLLHLQLLLLTWVASADNSRVEFAQEAASCPSADLQAALADGSARQLIGARNLRTCVIECSLWQQCVAVHHRPENDTCQLASLKPWLKYWGSVSSCSSSSFIRPPPLPVSLQPKLLAFYNFRFSLANQVNSSAFPVVISNANRSRLGLQLLGQFNSYADVDLMGQRLTDYLGPERGVSFFIKVSATYDFGNPCFHVLYNKTGGAADGQTGKWCSSTRQAKFSAHDLSEHAFTSAGTYFPSDMINQLTYSTAVSFSPAAGAKFFYNGTSDPLSPVAAPEAGVKGDQGLRIGYDMYYPFKGFVHCYGIAKAALMLADMQMLDDLC